MQLIVLLISLAFFYNQGIKFERGFTLIFLSLTVGFLLKLTFCILMFGIDWSVHELDELKFVVINLSQLSYLLAMYSFDMLIAKLFSLLFALARRRMSQAIKKIKKTNSLIFCVGVIFISASIVQAAITTSVFIWQSKDSNKRRSIQEFAVYSKISILILQGCL